MEYPLEGVDAKIERAINHLDQFCKDADRFERDAYGVRIEPDVNAGTLSLFTIDRGLGDPPIQLRLLAGEIAYQLRSALDHVIYILAKKTPDRSRQFPIFLEPQEYETRAASMIKGVSSRAEAIIKNAQPFRSHTPNEHPLRMLNNLNNTDKHRVIPACSIYATDIVIDFPASVNRYSIHFSPTCAKHGAKIATIPTPQDFKPEMEMDSKAMFTVAFTQIGNADLEPVIPLLHQLFSFVSNLVDDFRGEF